MDALQEIHTELSHLADESEAASAEKVTKKEKVEMISHFYHSSKAYSLKGRSTNNVDEPDEQVALPRRSPPTTPDPPAAPSSPATETSCVSRSGGDNKKRHKQHLKEDLKTLKVLRASSVEEDAGHVKRKVRVRVEDQALPLSAQEQMWRDRRHPSVDDTVNAGGNDDSEMNGVPGAYWAAGFGTRVGEGTRTDQGISDVSLNRQHHHDPNSSARVSTAVFFYGQKHLSLHCTNSRFLSLSLPS